MPKLSGLALSRLGVVLGCLLFVTGIGLAINLAAAFIAAGLLTVSGSLLLIDTDDVKGGRK